MITIVMISIHDDAQVYKNESVFGTIIGTKHYCTHTFTAEKYFKSRHKLPPCIPWLPNKNAIYASLGTRHNPFQH